MICRSVSVFISCFMYHFLHPTFQCPIIIYIYISFFLGKVTALGVLCCFALFVCLTLLASFFLPSHLSFKNMYIWFTLTQ